MEGEGVVGRGSGGVRGRGGWDWWGVVGSDGGRQLGGGCEVLVVVGQFV